MACTVRTGLLLFCHFFPLCTASVCLNTGSEDRGLVYQTDAEASVLTAVRDMFLGQPDGGSLVHRLAIFDAHGDITSIVSQMDVLRWAHPTAVHWRPTMGADSILVADSHKYAVSPLAQKTPSQSLARPLHSAASCVDSVTYVIVYVCVQAAASAPG